MAAAPGGGVFFQRYLHGLRGVAALAVLLFHWEQFFPAAGRWAQQFFPADTVLDPTIYVGFGWLGVPLFFVLSGLLLGAQVAQADLSGAFLTRFWRRRFFRIYPAVWLQLIVLLIVATFLPGLISQASYQTLWLQVLLWVNLPPAMASPLNGVWWTLPVELGFYVLLPLVGWASQRVGWVSLLVAGLAVTLVWRLWLFSTFEGDNYQVILTALDSLPGVLFTFMLGYSLNFLPNPSSERAKWRGLVIALVVLLALFQWQLTLDAVYWSGHWILLVWPPMVAVAVAGLVYCLREPPKAFHWLGTPVFMWWGNISFGIYLWHFPVMRCLVMIFPESWGSPEMSLLALFVSAAATFVLATISFYLVERPLMGWGSRPGHASA